MAKKLQGPKSKAWDEFARWIRVKGCIESTGIPFVGVCITCGKRFHISFLDAGHLIPGRRNAVLLHEEAVNPQCRICNQGKHGCNKKYRAIMEAKYGCKQVDQWYIDSKKLIHDRDMDFEGKRAMYHARTRALLLVHGYSDFDDMMRGSRGI